MSAQGAEFERSGEKRLPLWEKTTEDGTKRQTQSLPPSVQYWKRAGSRAAPEASATLDGALFNKAQIVESFSKDIETQMWKKAAGHPLSTGMEKGITTDFAKKARSQLIKEGNFMAAACAGFSCLWTHPRSSPACGWIYSQPIFLCSL